MVAAVFAVGVAFGSFVATVIASAIALVIAIATFTMIIAGFDRHSHCYRRSYRCCCYRYCLL